MHAVYGLARLALFLKVIGLAFGLRSLQSWNALFQSDARVHFDSDHSFAAAHDEYTSKIIKEDNNYSNHRHPFILKFPENCGLKCHEKVKSRVGPERHSVLTSSYAQVLLETTEVSSLKSELGGFLDDYVAMLPALKIESKSQKAAMVDTKCSDIPEEGIVFQVIFAAPNSSRLGYVISSLETVVTESSASYENVLATLVIDKTGLVPNRENIVTYELKCRGESSPTAVITATQKRQLIDTLAKFPFVLWVEQRERYFPSNRWAKGLCQTGEPYKHPMFEVGLDGSGLIIGISDTGLDMSHCQFYDPNVSTPYDTVNNSHRKVVTYITYADSTDDAEGHGSHVTSTAAGKSNIQYGDFQKYDGNAMEAKIAFFDIGRTDSQTLTTPGSLNYGLLVPLYNAGARISSHSWGSSSNSYTSDARSVDQFMYDNPDTLVMYAAGNDGDDGANTVGSPSTFKNGISVGASISSYDVMKAVMGADIDSSLYSDHSMAGFSSQGPTADGRMKPDIAAPGWYTVAAKAIAGAENDHCDIQTLRGTSMASPAVAGNAVLVQQYFREGYYPSGSKNATNAFVPSGALIKAMLINSGKNMDTVTYDDGTQLTTGGYPSNIQGYGKIRLSDVLNFGTSSKNPISLFVMGDVDETSSMYASMTSTLTVDQYYIETPSSSVAPLRVTLAYTDVPGSPGSSHPLINDLNLVVKQGSQEYAPLKSSQTSINNVEMVVIESPCASCTYTIEISASTLSSIQPYALVATGSVTEVIVNSTSSSSSYHVDETIGEDTWKAISVMGLLCILLGAIVVYLHYFDVPAPRQPREKTFEEERQEQAAALQYYEEQQRQRNRRTLEVSNEGQSKGKARRRESGSGGSVASATSNRSRTTQSKKPKKSRKGQSDDASASSRL